MYILGIRIDSVDMASAMQKVEEFLAGDGQHTIFTPNPEMLVDAQKDEYFRNVLNKGSLNVCDGFGIQLVSHGELKRVAGIDFFLALCLLASRMGKRVYLLGGGDAIMQKAAENLHTLFPQLAIVGYTTGSAMTQEPSGSHRKLALDTYRNDVVIGGIIAARPDILFVGFGHGKQEKWIHEYVKEMPSVKIAMGVGGVFDIVSGRVRRAPQFMRSVGLEWLWRLVQEPRRIRRIWKATGKFLILFVVNRTRMKRM